MKLTSELQKKLSENFHLSAEKIEAKQVADFYINFPYEFKNVLGRDSVYIEGGRGTGKSMLLFVAKSNSMNTFTETKNHPWYCHIINLEKHPPACLSNLVDKLDEPYFSSLALDYANLFILSKILPNLNTYLCNLNFKPEIQTSQELSVLLSSEVKQGSGSLNHLVQHILSLENQKKNRLYNKQFDYSPQFERPDFLDIFLTALKKSIILNDPDIDFSNATITILIDEFDALHQGIQRIINSLIIGRYRKLNFKIAHRPEGITKNTSSDPPRIIQNHDIPYFYTNPYRQPLPMPMLYHAFFKRIADRRIQKVLRNITITDILGKSIDPTITAKAIREKTVKQTHNETHSKLLKQKIDKGGKIRFWGFKDVVNISSGVIRYYLLLIDRIIGRAKNHDLSSGPIPFEKQSQAIHEFSQKIYLETINELDSYRNEIKRLIDLLGRYFKKRLMESSLILNATMTFRITESEHLKKEINEILKVSIKHSCIQQSPLRKSKSGTVIEPVYHLNRIYAPVLNILPSSRDTVIIPAAEFNTLLTSYKEFERLLMTRLERSEKRTKETKKRKEKMKKMDLSERNIKQKQLKDFF